MVDIDPEIARSGGQPARRRGDGGLLLHSPIERISTWLRRRFPWSPWSRAGSC